MTPHTPEHRKIINFYASFALCLVLSCVPNMTVQNIAIWLSLVFLVWVYIERRSAADGSPLKTHAVYLVRTFWIWSSVFVAGMIIAGIYISLNGDMTVIDTMMQNIQNGAVPTDAEMESLFHDYFTANFDLVVKTAVVCLTPAQLYAAVRLYKGFQTLRAGQGV